jgi:outer membrane protein TolC
MHNKLVLLLVCLAAARAEVRTVTLREAVAIALKDNPDLVIARFDQAKAQFGVGIARDPFVPKLYGGSGAAKVWGYPASINGQPPSIFQAQVLMALYNRPQSYKVAEARESVRGTDLELGKQSDDIAYRAAIMWLDARQAAESLGVARRQLDSLAKLSQAVKARLDEGRALPLDEKRVTLDLARAGQRTEALAGDQENAEAALAIVLGFGPEDRARAAVEESFKVEASGSEDASVDNAIANSKELRILESRIQAKQLELREYKSSRLPVIDLVAQYNMLARTNFEDFFPGRFQRNNGQIGVSITVPLLVGSAARSYAGQAESEIAKLHAQVRQTRGRLALDTRRSFQMVRRAETARTVARLDLDVAREQVSVLLAQQEEGRAALKEVEQARIQESDKWIAFYEATHTLERVKLDLLRQTGTLVASLQ